MLKLIEVNILKALSNTRKVALKWLLSRCKCLVTKISHVTRNPRSTHCDIVCHYAQNERFITIALNRSLLLYNVHIAGSD